MIVIHNCIKVIISNLSSEAKDLNDFWLYNSCLVFNKADYSS